MDKPLPDYAEPPVVEVALSVQFEPIKSLCTPQLGVLWTQFRAQFPIVEEHPPIEPVIERFGTLSRAGRGGISFQMIEAPPAPRCWFLNQSGDELIQVQQDRFVHNWRKTTGNGQYPRYRHLRATFERELQVFRDFLRCEKLGELTPNQCEVTYVNHVVAGNGWRDFGDLGNILAVFRNCYSDEFLSKPDDARLALRYTIRNGRSEPLGRLHVVAEPAFRTTDDQPMYVINLTARGRPDGEGLDGALRFLDIGRQWVVRGFTSITTAEMHRLWRKQDGQ